MARGMPASERPVVTVTEVTRRIRLVLERAFEPLWIEGEMSNVALAASGHLYFTLKDADAEIRSVMWRSDCAALRFQPKDGLRVQAFGQITVYEKRGAYQLVVRRMDEAGQGSLQAQFEALRAKLQAEGLFDADRKRPLPLLPRHVGVVTSPAGAALRDILKVMLRRFPNVHLTIAPARVQGPGAADEIAAAIDLLNARGGLDVMIVGRGGGSAEDLWCFNEEVVARSVARSSIPVISAVGHEVDFTICDFVADLRAPTPSAAAELVVGRKEDFEREIRQSGLRLARALRSTALAWRNRLTAAAGSYVFREPRNLARQHRQRLAEWDMRARHALVGRAGAAQQRADEGALRMRHSLESAVDRRRQDVRRLELQLRALSPLAVLDRGYSLTRRADGAIVRAADEVRPGERVRTRVSRGEFESAVVPPEERQKQ